ncbi:hypothetical protein AB0383_42505 [Amycolatopsis sp. NPDC051373]|uniref:hypothetical protein n=1 Tax=Amycolatopsis sp. NPDC051373 TaxID=3155801 RepID=UPI00344FEEAE
MSSGSLRRLLRALVPEQTTEDRSLPESPPRSTVTQQTVSDIEDGSEVDGRRSPGRGGLAQVSAALEVDGLANFQKWVPVIRRFSYVLAPAA